MIGSSDSSRALYLEMAACGIEVWVEGAFDEDGAPAEEPPDAPVRVALPEEAPAGKLASLLERINATDQERGLWTVCVSLNERYRAIREEGRA